MLKLTPRATMLAPAAAGLLALVAGLSCWPFSGGGPSRGGPFLGPADFSGQPLSASPPPTPTGQATWNGFLTFTNLERSRVENLLPAGYELATNSSLPAAHPVALIFGDQTDGVTFVAGQPVPVNPVDRVHYTEMILGVPFVQKTSQQGWHTYVVRMYLDYAVAVAGGVQYDYAKEFACLDWTGWGVKIWQQPAVCQPPVLLAPRQLLAGSFRVTSKWRSGPDALAHTKNFSSMVDIWTTKLLGRHAASCSFFDWDLNDAQVARAATTYRFLSPLRSDMTTWPALGDLDSVADGAVAVRGLHWGLGAPVGC